MVLLRAFELVLVLLVRGEALHARLGTHTTPAGLARGIAVAHYGALPRLLHRRVVAGRGLSSPAAPVDPRPQP